MTMQTRMHHRSALAAVSLVMTLLLLAACQPIQPMSATEAAEATATPAAAEAVGELPELTIELSADGIVVPAEVMAGPTIVTLVNSAGTTGEDGSPIMPEVGRFVEGATLDQLMGLLAEADVNPGPALELVKLYGFPFAGDGRIVWDLQPGNHIALTTIGEPAMAEFTVVEGEAAAPPAADVQVQLADFVFALPDEVAAGPQTWELTNVGKQWHELVIVKLAEGATVDDLLAFFQTAGPEDVPPMELIAGYAPFGEGNRVWIDLDLAPGEYTVLCFLPDVLGDMSPHAAHGMVRTLVVN